MTAADGVAIVLVLALTLFAWSGLADYGAGFWDLLSGGREAGRRPRALIDAVITPVYEANHVWLIYLLILCWTGFGVAFGSIMTTLFVPLALAALGIVLRGANFALRKDAARAGARHVAAWLFGLGSVLTPFCLGAALAAVFTGRVPVESVGNQLTSWWNTTSILVGLLAVTVGAFMAAVYLIAEADSRSMPDLKEYFRVRAIAAGVAGLLLGIGSLVSLRADSSEMFQRFVTRGSVLIVLGVLALATALLLAARGTLRRLRLVAGLGVAALVWAWGVAQYPYLLPFTLTIADGAGAEITQKWLLAWFVLAILTLGPALALLYVLQQRGGLIEDPTTAPTAPLPDLTEGGAPS